MYLNERSWEVINIPSHDLKTALVDFVKLYSDLAQKYRLSEVYVPSEEEPYLRHMTYTVAKWLSEIGIEYRQLFLSFWQKRIIYQPEDEYEAHCDSKSFLGATEAILHDSFVISLGSEEKWRKDVLSFGFYSLSANSDTEVEVPNVFAEYQLEREPVLSIIKRLRKISIYSYEELWRKKNDLFPHLTFCPSVQKNLCQLEKAYLQQIVRKLLELDHCAVSCKGSIFQPELLSKTTRESEETLKQYRKEHTFLDDAGVEYIASWHMRFTGIAGRIFFVPYYEDGKILVCYIGKKLPNVSY